MHRSAWKYKLQVLWTVAKPGDVKVIKGLASILQTMLRKQDAVCAISSFMSSKSGHFPPTPVALRVFAHMGHVGSWVGWDRLE